MMKSPLAIVLISLFIVLGAIAVIVPAEASVFSNPIDNSHTYTNVWAPAKIFGSSHINVQQNEIVAGANGQSVASVETWTPNGTSAYVIAVPYGSQFWQTIDTNIQVNHLYYTTVYGGGVFTNWWLWSQVNVSYQQYSNSLDLLGSSVLISSHWYEQMGSTQTTGYQPIVTAQTAVKLNFTQDNINTMYGVLTFNVHYVFRAGINTYTGNGSAAGTGTGNTYAQMYVVPGTAVLNIPTPSTVIQGGTVYFTGQTWYGSYFVTVYNPQGTPVKTIIVPANTNPFNVSYTVANSSSSVGTWRITLTNSVVELEQQQFLDVLAYHGKNSNGGYLPTPTITLSKPGQASGYYTPGEVVQYTFTDTIQSSMTVTFLTYIFVGSQGQEPPQSSPNWISGLDGMNFTATTNSGNTYSYSGSFTIPSLAANQPITIIVYATAHNSSGFFGSKAAYSTIDIGYQPIIGHSSLLTYYLEIIGFTVAGLFAAYLIPDDILMKFAVFGSAIFSAVLIYSVNIIHIWGL